MVLPTLVGVGAVFVVAGGDGGIVVNDAQLTSDNRLAKSSSTMARLCLGSSALKTAPSVQYLRLAVVVVTVMAPCFANNDRLLAGCSSWNVGGIFQPKVGL